MLLKGFPNVITWGQQYNFGEKPTVTMYTSGINQHIRTFNQKQSTRNGFRKYNLHGLRVIDYYSSQSLHEQYMYGLRISDYSKLVIGKRVRFVFIYFEFLHPATDSRC